jgi:hypothetical protein
MLTGCFRDPGAGDGDGDGDGFITLALIRRVQQVRRVLR